MLGRWSGKQIWNILIALALFLAALSLVQWPRQSSAAAVEGLTLCYSVIIPSLFPFFVLSALTMELGMTGYMDRGVRKVMVPLFRVSGRCASALVLGLIGGYPVGAQAAVELYKKGQCSKTEAERMLAFCNTSGPAFILGAVGAGIFADSRVGVLLYLIHAVAAICVGILFRFYKKGDFGTEQPVQVSAGTKRFSAAFTDSVKKSFASVLNICAFVVLFAVIIRMFKQAGILRGLAVLFAPFGLETVWGERLLTGILEVSSGVWSLTAGELSAGSITAAAFMLGWGGLSVHCQVLSFAGDSGLSMTPYFLGKLLHGILSALLVIIVYSVIPLQIETWNSGWVECFMPIHSARSVGIAVIAAGMLWLSFLLGSRDQRKKQWKKA